MCCSSKSVEVIDSSSRYPQHHGNFQKSSIENAQTISNNNNEENILPKTSSQKKTLQSKGTTAIELGEYSEAITNYKEIISKYPDDESAYFNLGKIYLKLKLYD